MAGSALLVEWLRQKARPYIFTTAAPPLLAEATQQALRLIEQGDTRRAHLAHLIEALQTGLTGLPWPLLPSRTPIQPLIVGSNEAAVTLSEALLARGLRVPAIRPPTVPAGSARLRISVSAAHSLEDIGRLCDALHEIAGGQT